MSTRSVSQAFSNNSDANFRLWGKWISDGFSAFGWVQTSDTGQINWTTVLAPTLATTFMGYEIWRMNDTLQSTYPLFIKIEYGSAVAAATPAMAITYGTGSDGAGNLTGVFCARTVYNAASGVTTAAPNFASGDANRIFLLMAKDQGAAALISIERTHDAAGADSNIGIMVFSCMNSAWTGRQAHFTGLQPNVYTTINHSMTPPSGSGALAPDIHLFPVRCWTPGESFPSLNMCAIISTDFSDNALISVVGYDGTTRIYRVLGSNYPGNLSSNQQATKCVMNG
jgi:hypothetical protein